MFLPPCPPQLCAKADPLFKKSGVFVKGIIFSTGGYFCYLAVFAEFLPFLRKAAYL